jgi:hypothetical protein
MSALQASEKLGIDPLVTQPRSQVGEPHDGSDSYWVLFSHSVHLLPRQRHANVKKGLGDLSIWVSFV